MGVCAVFLRIFKGLIGYCTRLVCLESLSNLIQLHDSLGLKLSTSAYDHTADYRDLKPTKLTFLRLNYRNANILRTKCVAKSYTDRYHDMKVSASPAQHSWKHIAAESACHRWMMFSPVIYGL